MPLQPASRGFCLDPESDEISEFSTLGAKGEDSFWEIYALVANCPLEFDLLSGVSFATMKRQADGSVVTGWQALLDSAVKICQS